MDLANFWSALQNFFGLAAPSFVIFICITGILFFMIFSMVKFDDKNLGIVLSVLVGCILMFPVFLSYKNLVKAQALIMPQEELERLNQIAEIRRNEREISEKERELRKNAIAMEKQSIEIETLNESIKLMERAHLNITNFAKIFEVGLLQTNIKKTIVNKEIIGDTQDGMGLRANTYYDELLVIISHDVNAKFGIDLNLIKVLKTGEDSIIISGIVPKPFATTDNRHDKHVAEVRRINMKDNFGESVIDTISVRNDRESFSFAENRAWDFTRQFRESLSTNTELGYFDNSVIELSKNFLLYIFSPYFTNIEFSNREFPDAVPFLEFFRTEADILINQKLMEEV